MKIGIDCHTLDKPRTGVARYLSNLLKYWKNNKQTELVLYSMKNIKNPLNIKSTALYYNFSLPQKAKKDKVDILFLPFYMRPLFCKVPTAVAIHDISYIVHPEWFDFYHRIIYRFLSKKAIKKSKFIFASSEYTKREILKHYKINPEKIHTILLAVDEKLNQQKNLDKVRQTKEKYGIKNRYLFYLGTIFNRRHVLETIKAFGIILQKKSGYQFLISGRNLTYPCQDIEKELQEINQKFPNAIIKYDYLSDDDILYLYQGAEIFLYLSEYEGFGLPPLEAMACGVPVLSTKKTSLAEVLGDYQIWVENPGDIDEISGKMSKILNDERLRNELIAKGLERVRQFSWQKSAEETLKILNQEL